MSKKTPTRIVDGIKHELALWLVIEERADGVPVTLRLLQDQEQLGSELVAAGLCTQEEINNGTAQARIKPKCHLLWTPSKFMVKEKA